MNEDIKPADRALAERTEDAYSYSTYGRNSWAECYALLRRRGYTEREAEAIMRSKWSRWAADGRQGPHPTFKDLERFLDDPRNKCTRAAVAELVAGTF